jgi:hypothetical protein
VSKNRTLSIIKEKEIFVSGKRIVFCTFGSLGDLYPLLALAREMKYRGHSPVVATSPAYRTLIEAEKIAFHPVRPDVDISDPNILHPQIARGASQSKMLSGS